VCRDLRFHRSTSVVLRRTRGHRPALRRRPAAAAARTSATRPFFAASDRPALRPRQPDARVSRGRRQKEVEGWIALKILVRSDGRVGDTKLVEQSPDPARCPEAAGFLAAYSRPFVNGNIRRRSWTVVRISFVLPFELR